MRNVDDVLAALEEMGDEDQGSGEDVRRMTEQPRWEGLAAEEAQQAAELAGWAEDEVRWMSHEALRIEHSLRRVAEEARYLLAEVRLARQKGG